MKALFKIFLLSGAFGCISLVNINSQGIVLPDVFPEADCYPIGHYLHHTYYEVKLTNLVVNAEYWITPKYRVFDGMLYTMPFGVLHLEYVDLSLSSKWEYAGEDPPLYRWKWLGPGTTYDVEYEFDIPNSALIIDKFREIGIYIKRDGYTAIEEYGKIQVVELNCNISGPNLICSGSQTFTLNHNNPDQPYSTINWVMTYPGGNKTGTGKVASRNFGSNPLNGNGKIKYTIDHTCGINDQYVEKLFWVGKPVPTITGEQYPECGERYWYFLDPEDHWGTYYWNVTYGLTIIGSRIGTKALIQADEEGMAAIYCNVTNSCGTGYGSLMVIVDCYGFKISPNPADDYIEISLDENKIDLNNINEYEIRIYNNQQILVNQTKTTKPSIILNTINFPDGLYIVNLMYEGKTYSVQLVIEH
jgi:uncharacterized ubiquitin-like protein YukD